MLISRKPSRFSGAGEGRHGPCFDDKLRRWMGGARRLWKVDASVPAISSRERRAGPTKTGRGNLSSGSWRSSAKFDCVEVAIVDLIATCSDGVLVALSFGLPSTLPTQGRRFTWLLKHFHLSHRQSRLIRHPVSFRFFVAFGPG